jgi:CheY-like chemotaxis protein
VYIELLLFSRVPPRAALSNLFWAWLPYPFFPICNDPLASVDFLHWETVCHMERPVVRVLIVDDYEKWRRFLRLTLAVREQLQIIAEVTDGPEAIQKAEELQPDLILLDIGLPTLNGIEAARRIREVSPNSKILFISENRSQDIAREALSTGAGGYVVKSDAAGELLHAIKVVLEGKRFISASLAGHFLLAATFTTTHSISWIVTLISGAH